MNWVVKTSDCTECLQRCGFGMFCFSWWVNTPCRITQHECDYNCNAYTVLAFSTKARPRVQQEGYQWVCVHLDILVISSFLCCFICFFPLCIKVLICCFFHAGVSLAMTFLFSSARNHNEPLWSSVQSPCPQHQTHLIPPEPHGLASFLSQGGAPSKSQFQTQGLATNSETRCRESSASSLLLQNRSFSSAPWLYVCM